MKPPAEKREVWSDSSSLEFRILDRAAGECCFTGATGALVR